MDINKIISDAENCDYIHDYPVESFSIGELVELAKLGKNHKVKVELHYETSNYYQGVTVQVYKWPLPWKCDFNNMPAKETEVKSC